MLFRIPVYTQRRYEITVSSKENDSGLSEEGFEGKGSGEIVELMLFSHFGCQLRPRRCYSWLLAVWQQPGRLQ